MGGYLSKGKIIRMEAVELISRCKAGERQALHLLYQQYKPKLLKICRHYTKDQDVAEDLLHDAFVIILTSLEKLENPEKLESWMATIVRNTGYHYCEHLEERAGSHTSDGQRGKDCRHRPATARYTYSRLRPIAIARVATARRLSASVQTIRIRRAVASGNQSITVHLPRHILFTAFPRQTDASGTH